MTEADRQYRAATQNFQRLRAEEKMRDDALVKARDAAWLRKMWRPIETCPSDTVVLLYTPHLHVTNPERVEARVFRDTKGGSQHAWATHWMPLPLAPSESSDGVVTRE